MWTQDGPIDVLEQIEESLLVASSSSRLMDASPHSMDALNLLTLVYAALTELLEKDSSSTSLN